MVAAEDMESETMPENEDSTMSEEPDAETSRGHQKKDILGNIKIKIMVLMMVVIRLIYLYTDDDDEDQHYSRKKSKFDPWQVA